MTWNYRVLKHVTEGEEEYYRIHEVYYEDDGEISSCSKKPRTPYGDTVEELQEEFKLMKAAFDKPAISYEDI